MQHYPTKNLPQRQPGTAEGEISPVLRLARRIREEQGPEQVKAFISAMRPFAAPNELRRVSEGFGIDYESIPKEPFRERETDRRNDQAGSGRSDQLAMLRTLMQFSGMMRGGGADPMKLISLLTGNK